MHPYQVDHSVRTWVILLSAAAGTALAYCLSKLLQGVPELSVWYIDYPSVLGFFGLVLWLFDNYLWKIPLVQHIGFVRVPDLNGDWKAEIASSSDQFQAPLQAQVHIKQTAARISISLAAQTSRSRSVHASLLPKGPSGEFELIYTYLNEPGPASPDTMSIHYGTAVLRLSEAGTILEGTYYTGRGRQTHGKMTVQRP